MKQRLFTLFIFSILCILLISCSFSEVKEKEEKPPWQGVINLWDFPRWPDSTGNRYSWIENKISEFEKANPGVFIHLRRLKWEYGMIELRAAIATGIGPDIAPIGADFDFISEGYLEPLDGFFTQKKIQEYHPKALEAVTYNERIYGYPWFMTTNALFLNKNLFEKRDVKPPIDGKWGYGDFAEAMAHLTYDENNDGKKDYFGFNFFLSPGNYQAWGFLTMDGARVFDEEGNFTLNCPEGISALTKLLDLSKKYDATPEDYGFAEEKKVWGDFSEEKKLAVYPAGPWAINLLDFDFDIAMYPDGDSEAISTALVSAYGILKQEDEEKKKICEKFLQFITSEEEQEVLSSYGVFPVYNKILDNISDAKIFRLKSILESSVLLPRIKNFYKIDDILITKLRLVFMGKKTPQEALADAALEIYNLK